MDIQLRAELTRRGIAPGISQRMLGHTLRALTRDGPVTRTAYAEVPPRVEYELTDLGRSLASAVDQLVGWVKQHLDAIVDNPVRFDSRTPGAMTQPFV